MFSNLFRSVVTGAGIGVLAVVVVGAASHLPPAWAQEEPAKTLLSSQSQLFPPAFDASKLVRISDQDYLVGATGASLEAISSVNIRKIGYGKNRFVTVTTTSSGVYSTDGLISPHIRYPGIEVTRVPNEVRGNGSMWRRLAEWSPRRGWVARPTVDADSFRIVAPFDQGTTIASPGSICVLTRIVALC